MLRFFIYHCSVLPLSHLIELLLFIQNVHNLLLKTVAATGGHILRLKRQPRWTTITAAAAEVSKSVAYN